MSATVRPRTKIAALAGLSLAGLVLSLASAGTASAASVATWDKVAHCESTDNWSTNTGNDYYGGLQISKPTWDAYGGQKYAAYPHQATKQQQVLIAEKILAGQGAGAWGTCGAAAGLAADHADPYPDTDPAAPAVFSKVHLYGVGSDNRVYGNNADYSAGTWDGYNTVDGAQ
ncbi:transglycosylase family protein, partial [Streptomyces virginiae]